MYTIFGTYSSFVDGCLLSCLDWTTDSHLKRIISTNNIHIYTVVPPDDGHRFLLNDCL